MGVVAKKTVEQENPFTASNGCGSKIGDADAPSLVSKARVADAEMAAQERRVIHGQVQLCDALKREGWGGGKWREHDSRIHWEVLMVM